MSTYRMVTGVVVTVSQEVFFLEASGGVEEGR